MDTDNAWFTIQLALVGTPTEVITAAVPDLQDELNQRTHLRKPRVEWNPDTLEVIVEVEDDDHDPKRAAAGMAEELFEITAAVLGPFETFHIDILRVERQIEETIATEDS